MKNTPKFDAEADGWDGGIDWDLVRRHLSIQPTEPQQAGEPSRALDFEPCGCGCEHAPGCPDEAALDAPAPRESAKESSSRELDSMLRASQLRERATILPQGRRLKAALDARHAALQLWSLAREAEPELEQQAHKSFREAWWALWLARLDFVRALQQQAPSADDSGVVRALNVFEEGHEARRPFTSTWSH